MPNTPWLLEFILCPHPFLCQVYPTDPIVLLSTIFTLFKWKRGQGQSDPVFSDKDLASLWLASSKAFVVFDIIDNHLMEAVLCRDFCLTPWQLCFLATFVTSCQFLFCFCFTSFHFILLTFFKGYVLVVLSFFTKRWLLIYYLDFIYVLSTKATVTRVIELSIIQNGNN